MMVVVVVVGRDQDVQQHWKGLVPQQLSVCDECSSGEEGGLSIDPILYVK